MPPIDRVHFLDEQRRNRRRSLRFSFFAIVAVALSGIPLCALIAPLGIGLAVVGVHLLDLVVPVSPDIWHALDAVVHALPRVWNRVLGGPVEVPWAALAACYVVPGAVLMLVTWPFVLRLTRRAGAGMILRRLPSRPLDASRFAERQLQNVVEEMAVAAAVPPPSVRIIDSAAVNAVAVGLNTSDVALLVTTGFLERLDRDERQAVVAHLMGSVGNGDLEIAAIILSVFETWGLVSLLLEAPVHRAPRIQLRRFARIAGRSLRRPISPDEASQVIDPLLGGAAFDVDPLVEGIMRVEPRSVHHACLLMLVLIPLIALLALASVTARQTISVVTALGFGPWLAAMWRARRRLADATAVQLTRHPAALAQAVQVFDQTDVEVPGGWVAYFLFPVWVPITDKSAASQTEAAAHIVGMRLEAAPRLKRLAALGARLDAGADLIPRGLAARIRDALPNGRELITAVGWGLLCVLLLGVLIGVTLAGASLALMLLWWALGVLRT